MITENTLVVSDRDIRKKAEYGNYLAIDIKKGEPFYPRSVSPSWMEKKLICVPAFAGLWNQYPAEWFSEYDPEYAAMQSSICGANT